MNESNKIMLITLPSRDKYSQPSELNKFRNVDPFAEELYLKVDSDKNPFKNLPQVPKCILEILSNDHNVKYKIDNENVTIHIVAFVENKTIFEEYINNFINIVVKPKCQNIVVYYEYIDVFKENKDENEETYYFTKINKIINDNINNYSIYLDLMSNKQKIKQLLYLTTVLNDGVKLIELDKTENTDKEVIFSKDFSTFSGDGDIEYKIREQLKTENYTGVFKELKNMRDNENCNLALRNGTQIDVCSLKKRHKSSTNYVTYYLQRANKVNIPNKIEFILNERKITDSLDHYYYDLIAKNLDLAKDNTDLNSLREELLHIISCNIDFDNEKHPFKDKQCEFQSLVFDYFLKSGKINLAMGFIENVFSNNLYTFKFKDDISSYNESKRLTEAIIKNINKDIDYKNTNKKYVYKNITSRFDKDLLNNSNLELLVLLKLYILIYCDVDAINKAINEELNIDITLNNDNNFKINKEIYEEIESSIKEKQLISKTLYDKVKMIYILQFIKKIRNTFIHEKIFKNIKDIDFKQLKKYSEHYNILKKDLGVENDLTVNQLLNYINNNYFKYYKKCKIEINDEIKKHINNLANVGTNNGMVNVKNTNTNNEYAYITTFTEKMPSCNGLFSAQLEILYQYMIDKNINYIDKIFIILTDNWYKKIKETGFDDNKITIINCFKKLFKLFDCSKDPEIEFILLTSNNESIKNDSIKRINIDVWSVDEVYDKFHNSFIENNDFNLNSYNEVLVDITSGIPDIGISLYLLSSLIDNFTPYSCEADILKCFEFKSKENKDIPLFSRLVQYNKSFNFLTLYEELRNSFENYDLQYLYSNKKFIHNKDNEDSLSKLYNFYTFNDFMISPPNNDKINYDEYIIINYIINLEKIYKNSKDNYFKFYLNCGIVIDKIINWELEKHLENVIATNNGNESKKGYLTFEQFDSIRNNDTGKEYCIKSNEWEVPKLNNDYNYVNKKNKWIILLDYIINSGLNTRFKKSEEYTCIKFNEKEYKFNKSIATLYYCYDYRNEYIHNNSKNTSINNDDYEINIKETLSVLSSYAKKIDEKYYDNVNTLVETTFENLSSLFKK